MSATKPPIAAATRKPQGRIDPTVLLIATFDTKQDEALFLKARMEFRGARVLTMDVGTLGPRNFEADFSRSQVASAAGYPLEEGRGFRNQSEAIELMSKGVAVLCRDLHRRGDVCGVVGIGGAQGTEIACAGMRELPIGVPRVMVSTIACGQTTFGPLVGTSDITVMHSVADLQGLNFVTMRVLDNAAGAIVGMVNRPEDDLVLTKGVPIALSMLGTTTEGALRCKRELERRGFEVVAFHQNGTGGIAMEDLIRAGAFRGVLDLNLHEIADRYVGGLHGAIRDNRLEAAGDVGIPTVVAPGSINYAVMGPIASLGDRWRLRPCVVHNRNLTLVRLNPEELFHIGGLVAAKLNRATGSIRVFVPLKGFSSRDREGMPHWQPEGHQAFLAALKGGLRPTITITEVDANINDVEFTGAILAAFFDMMTQPGGLSMSEGAAG